MHAWNNARTTEWIFIKSDIRWVLIQLVDTYQFLLQSDNNEGYFTCVYVRISQISITTTDVLQKCEENDNILCWIRFFRYCFRGKWKENRYTMDTFRNLYIQRRIMIFRTQGRPTELPIFRAHEKITEELTIFFFRTHPKIAKQWTLVFRAHDNITEKCRSIFQTHVKITEQSTMAFWTDPKDTANRTVILGTHTKINYLINGELWPPLWSSGQSFWLQIQRTRVRFPALPDFLRSSGSGAGSTQPRKNNWGAIWMEK
jgi:hypothetical protein